MGGTGFTRHAEPRDLRFGCRTAWAGSEFEHVSNCPRSLGRHDPLTDRGLFAFQKGQRDDFAITGKDGIGAGQLQQRHRDPVTIGHRRLFDWLPGLPGAHSTSHCTRKSDLWRLSKTQRVIKFPHPLRGQLQRDLGGAHVRGFLQHLLDRQGPVAVRIANRCRANRQLARAVDHRTGLDDPRLERGRNRERLESGARLKGIGHHPVTQLSA